LKFSDALSAVDRDYLGLTKTGEFTLLDIPAPGYARQSGLPACREFYNAKKFLRELTRYLKL
jgi:hypothetical protein